ncbi:MAG: hypothetical protein CM15mP51_13110 [Porticoccaceae bacterium]|nr:MAG: hypothetical protein CM15mP51_13110 [Porticoccaceae bacterium]
MLNQKEVDTACCGLSKNKVIKLMPMPQRLAIIIDGIDDLVFFGVPQPRRKETGRGGRDLE